MRFGSRRRFRIESTHEASGWPRWAAIAITMAAALNSGAGAAEQAERPFEIQAHRGNGIKSPENSLESFTASWKLGVTPEADLRMTADGAIVCFHDPDFTRVSSGLDAKTKALGVEKLPLAKVEQIEVGQFRGERFAGEHIPALADVLAAMTGRPERRIYLDIKTELVDLDALAKLIHQSKTESQIIFTTQYHQLIRDWKKRMPESLSLLWNGGKEAALRKKLAAVRKANFEGITFLQIHVHVADDLKSPEPFDPPTAFLKEVRDELKQRHVVFQVLPWECDNPEAYRKLLELGAESFATDYPQMTLEVVREFQKRRGKP
jgi:glycerophosphoryl diester phosphodiesterase